jgi:hypothetical protein
MNFVMRVIRLLAPIPLPEEHQGKRSRIYGKRRRKRIDLRR